MTLFGNIPVRNIFYMLSYVFKELKADGMKDVASEDFRGAEDLFADILARGLSALVRQNLRRAYVLQSESLPTLRGQLDFPETIRLFSARRRRLACEFDEMSADNLFNRVLKSTIALLLKCPVVDAERRKRLHQILPFFGGVSDCRLELVKWNRFVYDRNTRRYELLMTICRFIWENWLLTTTEGRHRQSLFGHDQMHWLYEKFLLGYFKRHYPHLRPQVRGIPWALDERMPKSGQLPSMKSDVYLSDGAQTLIIDAKFYARSLDRHYDAAKVHSSNLYQIHAYVTNEDADRVGNVHGLLLYAKTTEEVTPEGRVTLKAGNRISFQTLDLGEDFLGIRKRLESFLADYFPMAVRIRVP